MKKILISMIFVMVFLNGCSFPRKSQVISPKAHFIEYVIEKSILGIDRSFLKGKTVGLIASDVNNILEDKKDGFVSKKFIKYFERTICPIRSYGDADMGIIITLHHDKIKMDIKRTGRYKKDLVGLVFPDPSSFKKEEIPSFILNRERESYLTIFVLSLIDLETKEVLYANSITAVDFSENNIMIRMETE